MTKNLKNNYLWNFVGIVINSLTSFVYLLIITRFLGIEYSAIFSFVYSIGLLLFNISMFGGRILHVSDTNKKNKDLDYFSFKLLTSIGGILILLFILVFSNFKSLENQLLLFIGISKIIEVISDYFYGIFQKNHRLDLVGKSITIRSIISMFLFFIIIYFFKNITLAILSIFFVNLINLFVFDIYKSKKYIKLNKLSYDRFLAIFKDTKYLFLINVITFLILNTTRFFSYKYFEKEIQGFLGIIIMIPTLMAIISEFIYQPQLLNLKINIDSNNKQEITKYLIKNSLFIIFVGFVGVIIISFGGQIIFNYIFNFDFFEYKNIISVFIFAGAINAICILFSNVFTIMRKLNLQIKIYSFVLILLILFYIFFDNITPLIFSIIFLFSIFVQFLLFSVSYLKIKVGV